MLEELGISLGTAIVMMIAFYCVIKSAVRNAIEEAKSDIKKAVAQGIRDYHDGKVYEDDEDDEEDEEDELDETE